MRKILKALSLVMVLVMCFTMVFTTAVSAEGTTPTLTINSAAVKEGETVTITVDAANFGAVAGAHFVVALPGELENVTVAESDFVAYDAEAGTVTFVKEANWTDGNCDGIADGALVTITATAAVGTYDVKFADTGKTVDFCDANLAALDVTKVEGKVVVETAEPPVYEDENLKIRSAGITMANGFALDFKVRKTMETSLGYSDIYIEFSKPRYDADGNVTETVDTTVVAAERTDDPASAENYLYTLDGIQPQEIGTTVTATIYGTKDGNVYKGSTVEYSVLKFATNQLKNLTETSKATAAQITCADIIMYGAAVQAYAEYNTANPIIDAADALCASSVWQNFATAEITRELVNAQTNTALEGANVRIRSAGVILSSKVILYFNCANLGVQTLENRENYAVRVSYEDVNGDTKTYDLDINASYQAELDTLYSTELGTVVTATMIDKATGNPVSNTVTYSIETFLSKNLTHATNGGWCTTLVKYGDAVRAYAGLS